MDVSIVIVTKNRANQLTVCLDHAIRVRPPGNGSLRIIVGDNGSTDHTRAVIERAAHRSAVPVTYVFYNSGGKAETLNQALKQAATDIIVFVDDDCYCDKNIAVAYAQVFGDASVGYAGGRVLLFDETDLRVAIQESREPMAFPPLSYIRPGLIHGANMAFRRTALMDIGGFDPRFGPGGLFRSGDDIDAWARASGAGWRGVYAPEPLVHHHHGRKASDRKALAPRYLWGRGIYLGHAMFNYPQGRKYILPFIVMILKALAKYPTGRTFGLMELQAVRWYLAYQRARPG